MGEINSGTRVLPSCIKLRIVYVCKDGGFLVLSGSQNFTELLHDTINTRQQLSDRLVVSNLWRKCSSVLCLDITSLKARYMPTWHIQLMKMQESEHNRRVFANVKERLTGPTTVE